MKIKNKSGAVWRENIEKFILYIVFLFYIFLLIKILLLSRVSLSEMFDAQRDVNRYVKLIPLHSIREYISGCTDALRKFSYANVVGNIIIFVPLGAYLSLFKKDKGRCKTLLFIFTVSFVVEVAQWFFNIGSADVDDIILNCLGGLAGIVGYKLLVFILRNEERAKFISSLEYSSALFILMKLIAPQ